MSQKLSELTRIIRVLINSYPNANNKLKDALFSLCEELQSKNIVHANSNPTGKAWGADLLLDRLCEKVDPVLLLIFPINSEIYQELNLKSCEPPLKKYLANKNYLRSLFARINFVVEGFGEDLEKNNYQGENWEAIATAGENLSLLSEVLEAIHNVQKATQIKWCRFCFRIADTKGKFCEVHRPQNDTRYRVGKRIKQIMCKSSIDKINSIHSRRIMLGESFTLLSANDDIHYHPATNYVVLDKQIKSLLVDTQQERWGGVSTKWKAIISSLPLLKTRLNLNHKDYITWQSFRTALIVNLQNRYEKTENPYWILLMLVEAELWFEQEAKNADRRLNKHNYNEVLNLISKALSVADIAKKCNLSKGYVYKIRRQYVT